MAYLGGKFRVRYQISEYINSLAPRTYLEPFCGYCWVGERVRAQRKVFSDANEDLILMWQAIQGGWVPPSDVSEDLYNELRDAPPSALRGFVGAQCSFGGKWFAGYSRGNSRSYANEGRKQLLRRLEFLSKAVFTYQDYKAALRHTDAQLVYCDPPYAATTTYGATGVFDSAEFWNEIRRESRHRTVLVSEYEAPKDFTAVLTCESYMGLRTRSGEYVRQEKLFTLEPIKKRQRVSFASLLEG